MRVTAQWLFIICLPVLLLAAVIGILANSLCLYEYGASKYGVGESLAEAGLKLSDAELSGIYAGLIDYYNSGEEYVRISVVEEGKQVDVLTPEEVLHFRDVRGLIRLDYWLLSGTLAYFLVFIGLSLFLWHEKRRLGWGLLGGSILTLALLLVLVLFDRLFGFGELFLQFHFVFFNNLFWSTPGNMLLLFPENFFIDAVTIGAAILAGAAIVLGGVGWWMKAKSPAKKPS
jgi:integral membrane protein (TIGR01906 family)